MFTQADQIGTHLEAVNLKKLQDLSWFRSLANRLMLVAMTLVVGQVAIAQCPSAGSDNSATPICSTQSVDLFTLLGGTPDTGGIWIDEDNTGQVSGGVFTAAPVPQGFYRFIYVVSDVGCTNDSAMVTVLVQTNADAGQNSTDEVCLSDTDADLFDMIDGNPDAGGTWTDDDNSGGLNVDRINPSTMGVGTYDFTYTVTNSCTTDDAVVTVTVAPGPTVDAGEDMLVFEGQVITFSASVETGAAYEWSPTTGLDAPLSLTSTATPTAAITYTLTAEDVNGCINSDQINIAFEENFGIVDAFTPDGDGKNDTWIITSLANFPDSEVLVFNRRGNKVYTSEKGYPNPWDGTSGGTALPVATYYYIINLNNGSDAMTGNVTLLR